MIPEKEREALMRLTMCAREECGMCKYEGTCDFDFQYETATRCMNILADALRTTDRKTEPTISKMEQVEDEPQNGYQTFSGTSVYVSRFEEEPQTEEWTKEKHKAFYTFLWNTINPNEMQDYIEMFEGKSEPQTDCSWK